MTDVLRISGIALIGVFSAIILKERYKSIGFAVVACVIVLVCVYTINNGVSQSVGAVFSFVEDSDFSEYAQILLKALGIAYITTITQSLCSEAGENAIAGGVELFGKAQLILLSLPLVFSLLDIASELV